MDWKYIKPLLDEKLIKDFESLVDFSFSDDFINCVKINNGGRPSKKKYKTDAGVERTIKSFLSFNKNDAETVWKIYDWNKQGIEGEIVPFAIDSFGNLICFSRNNGVVVFFDHETGNTEKIAADFSKFINKLYE